jgi:hypothetical protein
MALNVNKLITECIYEVFKENLMENVGNCPTCGTPNSKCNCNIIARINAYKQLSNKITAGNATPEEIAQFQKERIWVKSILSQAGYGVQGGMYLRDEGFDPTSVGPNPPASEQSQINPYKEWNMKMRKMEENEHGRYAQQAGAGQFDPRTFGVNENNIEMNLDTAWDILVSYCTGAVHQKYRTQDTVHALSWALNRLKQAFDELEQCKSKIS